MAEIIQFPLNRQPKRRKPVERTYDVFVTFYAPWRGVNKDEAAMKFAQAMCDVCENVAEFNGDARVEWGVSKKKDPTS